MSQYQTPLSILATLLSLTSSDCPISTGCSSSAQCDVEFVARRVYGCGGVWGSHLAGIANAEFLCADGYSICDTYSWAETLGLTKELCLSNTLMTANYFYATLQSSSGSLVCDDTGINDVYGCASTDSDIFYIDDAINCGAFGAQMSTNAIGAGAWKYGWEMGSGAESSELTATYHWHTKEESSPGANDWSYTTNTAGGVVCCRDEIPAMNTTAMYYETTDDDMFVSMTDYYSTELAAETATKTTENEPTSATEDDGNDDDSEAVRISVFFIVAFVAFVSML